MIIGVYLVTVNVRCFFFPHLSEIMNLSSSGIRALRNHPKRIESFAEARSIRGVGEKTAAKVNFCHLFSVSDHSYPAFCRLWKLSKPVDYVALVTKRQRTSRRPSCSRVSTVSVGDMTFYLYLEVEEISTGQSTAYQWYATGCRTLEDLVSGKYGIKLSPVQEIGIKFYHGE